MAAPSLMHQVMPELLSGIGDGLRQVYQGAIDNSGLLTSDYMTLRDLLELSGYTDKEPLHALLLIMLAALNEGSLCVEINAERLNKRLKDLTDLETVEPWPANIVAELRDSGYSDLIARADQRDKPLVRSQFNGRTYLYFQRQFEDERALATMLGHRLQQVSMSECPGDLSQVLRQVLVEHRLRAGDQPLQLNPEQRLALGLALLRPFVLVSGGPGTGKTSIVLTLLRCLARLPGFDTKRIAVAAPTGRAADQLNQSFRKGLATLPPPRPEADDRVFAVSALTLHRLLGFNPETGTVRHHAENPLAVDLVIVDEVSMVGLDLMTRLFQALPTKARLVLLGDKDQLPSVDAGAVLANLTGSDQTPGFSPEVRKQLTCLFPDLAVPPAKGQGLKDAAVVLEENHRSNQSIQKIARAVNAPPQNVVTEIPSLKAAEISFSQLEQGCCRVDGTENMVYWRQVLRRWADHHYLAGRAGEPSFFERAEEIRLPASDELGGEYWKKLDPLFDTLQNARILTVVRDGPWGCTGINDFLQQTFRRRRNLGGRHRLFSGAAVLITRNDYNHQLFNGDVGLALHAEAGGYRIVLPRPDSYKSLLAEALPAHEFAFAMTVHKAQGSEYGQVLLVLPPAKGHRLLTKEMVYTGITRAKNLVAICGSEEILKRAIERRVEREANLIAQDGEQSDRTG
jgi:exodeoxyribonuclease V alpha subunit